MIKPLNIPQLSAARPRVGLQHVSDLIPRLIKMYELQAELAAQEIRKEVEERTAAQRTTEEFEPQAEEATEPVLVPADALASSINGIGNSGLGESQQATFGWYE